MCVHHETSGLTLSWEPVSVPHRQRARYIFLGMRWRLQAGLVSLSDLTYFCPPWDACLVWCVDLSSVHSPRFPAWPRHLVRTVRDQACPVAWFRWLLYRRIFTPSLEALISCSGQVFWHWEHTVWSCSAWGTRPPLPACAPPAHRKSSVSAGHW